MYRWEWVAKLNAMSAEQRSEVEAGNRARVQAEARTAREYRAALIAERSPARSADPGRVDGARAAWEAAQDALNAAQYEQGIGPSAQYQPEKEAQAG